MSEYYYNDYGRADTTERRHSLLGRIVDGVMMILSVVAGLAMIFTLLSPYIHPSRYWIFPVFGLIAPAVYAVVVLFTLYWIIRWRWRVAAPLLLLLILGFFKVSLFLKPELRRHYGEEARYGSGTITVMTYNVRSFYSDQKKWSFDSVAMLIHQVDPDIICIQEFGLKAEDMDRMDALLPEYTRSSVPTDSSDGNSLFYPIAVYTKYRVLGTASTILRESPYEGQSTWVDLRIGEDTVRIINNHLHSTSITADDEEFLSKKEFLSDTASSAKVKSIVRRFHNNSVLRANQADTIAQVIRQTHHARIVCGDFNDTPMSYVYRTMSKGLDDAFSSCGKGYSYTFRGFMDALRIDYVLYSEPLECLSYEVLYDVKLSDHYPVVVRLRKVDAD